MDKTFVNSDEFQSILSMTIRQLETADESEKRRHFKNILAHSIMLATAEEERKKDFVRILGELSPKHLLVLKGFAEKTTYYTQGKRYPIEEEGRLEHDLYRYYLVNDQGSFSPQGHNYVITKFGLAFLQYIMDPE